MYLVCRLLIMVLFALAPAHAVAQIGPGPGQMMQDQATGERSMKHPLAPTPFYLERTFLVLVGFGIGGVGYFVYRVVRARWRSKKAPTEFSTEAVLVVDLVGSTHLATHYGKGVAMRASKKLHDRILALAEPRGLTFSKSTGDGCLTTFPTVADACETAIVLLREIIDGPSELMPAVRLELRAGISYGEIIVDGGNDRFGSAINKAFRLEGLSRESFTQVEGENSKVQEIADRNRIFLDEEAANELQSEEKAKVPLHFLGFAKLKGFSGLHRVYEVHWSAEELALSNPFLDQKPGTTTKSE